MILYLISGIIYGLSAGISPGPLLALVISESVRNGTRAGIRVALSPLLTDLPVILLSTLALSWVAGFNLLLGGITLAGGLFVFYLAWESLRAAPLPPDQPAAAQHSLRRGVMVNALNPHPYLFWLTVGAPTLLRAWNETPFSAAGFLLGFYACLVGSKVVVAWLVGRWRSFFTGPAYRWIMRLLGVLLAVFAVLLVREGLGLLGLN
jgi:threonine/homoserine/homoserine lactone efflux protein